MPDGGRWGGGSWVGARACSLALIDSGNGLREFVGGIRYACGDEERGSGVVGCPRLTSSSQCWLAAVLARGGMHAAPHARSPVGVMMLGARRARLRRVTSESIAFPVLLAPDPVEATAWSAGEKACSGKSHLAHLAPLAPLVLVSCLTGICL